MNLLKRILSIVAISIAGLSSQVLADDDYEGFYTAAYIGANQINDISFGALGTVGFETGPEYQVGAGYDLGRFRIEGQYARSEADFEKTTNNIVTTSIEANALIDFTNETKLVSFLGAGIGSTKAEATGEEDTVKYTNLIGGIGYKISDSLNLDLKYTYRLFEDITLGAVSVKEPSSSSLVTGLRFNF